MQGELVTSFEDHDLWYPDAQTNNIYITHNQSLILSYCKVCVLVALSLLANSSWTQFSDTAERCQSCIHGS